VFNFHFKIDFLESLSKRYDEFGKAMAPKSKTGKKVYDFLGYFSIKERVVFYTVLCIFVISFGLLLKSLNDRVTVAVPLYGGTLKEGVVGIPRFANPVLAATDVDRDVAALVYSGLMRVGADGTLIPDLAEKYTVSPDGLTYTFSLRKRATFHDGSAVTSEDVAYTIGAVKNPIFKSPVATAWAGVTIETPDTHTVIFHLKAPYALFLEHTTLGILPKQLWKSTNDETFPYSDLNLRGVGSGPYRVTDVRTDKDGVPTSLTLSAFKNFTLGRPYIKTVELKFYTSEESRQNAMRAHTVDAISGVAAESVARAQGSNARVVTFFLPRIFAVFFNQNQVPAFTYREVRVALDTVLSKEHTTRTVLHEYGNMINGPIPPGSFGYASSSVLEKSDAVRLAEAKALLESNSWKLVNGVYQKSFANSDKKKPATTVSLTFSLATADTPELKRAAELIRDTWTQLGARVDLKIYEVGDLNQNIIRPRTFDALFFGEIVGRNPDPFFYWHSSERKEPGLNIAQYANPVVDTLVQNIRTSADTSVRLEKLRAFEAAVKRDVPAAFIYAPQYIYLMDNTLKGVASASLTYPHERFSNIHTWYIDTERVWKIFSK